MKYILLIVSSLMLVGCMDEYLSIKSDKSLVIPATLQDFRALMDNADVMNQVLPYLGHVSSDDFFMFPKDYDATRDIFKRNAYIWKADIYEGVTVPDWNRSYQQIFYANNVLEGLQDLNSTEPEAKILEGTALFFRAFAFYNLSQLFCGPYRIDGENTDLGLPLRLNKDINKIVGRSTVGETYQQMVVDLEKAIPLLPEESIIKTRPTRYTALLLLARLHLLMGDYRSAKLCSEEIVERMELIDFNTLKPEDAYPMAQYNKEVLLHSSIAFVSTVASTDYVDSTLMDSYEIDDLRKSLWFIPKEKYYIFKGNYTGGALLFNGLALDEAFLIHIEALGRLQEWERGREVLRQYLKSRYKVGSQINLTMIQTNESLIDYVLEERRKALLYRTIRWTDIRRLNKNYDANIVLSRRMGNTVIELPPNHSNFALPIPDDVIFLSGIQQNERE